MNLAAAVDLDGSQRERQRPDEFGEEAPRALARSVLPAVAREQTRATMNFENGQTADEPTVRELLEHAAVAVYVMW